MGVVIAIGLRIDCCMLLQVNSNATSRLKWCSSSGDRKAQVAEAEET
jgi:hypothetical protein